MAYTENKKAIGLDAKTTPIDADVLVVGDTADSDRAKKTTWANIKATLKTYFDTLFVTAPASSTDNAIARFDGTTGKVLQNSGIAIRDFEQSGANEESIAARYVASGTSIDLAIFAGGTNLNGRGGNLRIGGNEGNGAFPGGSGTLFGAQGGATGAGGAAVVQGGAGGATSGEGGTTYVHGGDATAGNSRGGNIIIAPGTKQGSEINGITSFKAHRGSTYVAAFNFDNIASSDKTFTFPNRTMTYVGSLKGTSASLAQNATETILTPTFGTYIVTIDATSADNTAWRGSWMVFANGSLVVTAITAPANVDLVISGGDIQVKNTNAAATALRWSYTCIGNNQ